MRQASLALIDLFDAEITSIESELRVLGAEHRYVPLLITCPGIAWILAFTIASELGDIARIPPRSSSSARPASAQRSTGQASATGAARCARTATTTSDDAVGRRFKWTACPSSPVWELARPETQGMGTGCRYAARVGPGPLAGRETEMAKAKIFSVLILLALSAMLLGFLMPGSGFVDGH
jgi:hypothetical protein